MNETHFSNLTANITTQFTTESTVPLKPLGTSLSNITDLHNVIFIIFLCVMVLTVNSLVVVAFTVQKKLRRNPANVLICSQAVADLFTGAVFIPVYLIDAYNGTSSMTAFTVCYIIFLSLFNLLALSTDRFLALSRPFLHYRLLDVQRTMKLLLLIWVTPLLLTLIPLFWWFKPINVQKKAGKIYLGIGWLFMLLLVIAMTILYLFVTTKATQTIRNKRQSIGHRSNSQTKVLALAKKELRVIHLFGLLLFFFVAAYLPILYMNFCDIVGEENYIPNILPRISFYFLILNSIVNPVLCIYLKKDYWEAILTSIRIHRTRLRNWSMRSSSLQAESQLEDSDSRFASESTNERMIEIKRVNSTSFVKNDIDKQQESLLDRNYLHTGQKLSLL